MSLFRTMYFLPVVTSAVAVGLVWNLIYARDVGLLNYILRALGGEAVNWLGTRNASYSVLIVNIWGAIGEGMIIFLAGLPAIPTTTTRRPGGRGERAGSVLKITLPLFTPSIFFQTIIATINAFQAFEYIYVLTRGAKGASQLPTMVYSIWQNGFRWFNMGSASAQAMVLAAILIVLTCLLLLAAPVGGV